MKQPYVYSMPESFLRDKNVPARWRVLAVINGFILNGGCFYGSNEWLMEQLRCSEPTVSSAFKELEDLKEIRTERTKRTRKVYKTSRDPSQFGSETQVEPSRDPSQLVPNSVSNSEKNTSVAIAPQDVIITSDSDKPEKKPKDRENEKIAKWWYRRCEEDFGRVPSGPLTKAMRVIGDARKKINNSQLKEMLVEHIEDSSLEEHDRMQITQAISSYKIDRYLSKV